jgi:F0F1-type ATP synthase membrane subunit b/b'
MVYQNRVDIPGYRAINVDLLGGMSRAAWAADSQARFQRLMALEGEGYQWPEDAGAPPPGSGILPNRPILSEGFEAVVRSTPGDGPVVLRLLDTSEMRRLLGRGYVLRDGVDDPDSTDDRQLYAGGRPLEKNMLDYLRARGVTSVTVVGRAPPVGFLSGTAIMVAIIFLTLVAVLQPILWKPFAALLEKRARELAAGEENERQNQAEAIRLEEERRRRYADLGREIQVTRIQKRREVAEKANVIIREAREKEKQIRTAGMEELDEAVRTSETELTRMTPAFAAAIADALMPGAGDARGKGEAGDARK